MVTFMHGGKKYTKIEKKAGSGNTGSGVNTSTQSNKGKRTNSSGKALYWNPIVKSYSTHNTGYSTKAQYEKGMTSKSTSSVPTNVSYGGTGVSGTWNSSSPSKTKGMISKVWSGIKNFNSGMDNFTNTMLKYNPLTAPFKYVSDSTEWAVRGLVGGK